VDLLTRPVLWYAVKPDQQVLLVIVRDVARIQRDDFFFTTDLDADPADVATEYACRWAIEDTFRAVKQHLGGQQPQTWKGAGPERAAALSFWIYTAIWCWYIPTHGHAPRWPTRPWYPTSAPPASPTPSPNYERPCGANELTPSPANSNSPHKSWTPSSTRSHEPPDPPEDCESPPDWMRKFDHAASVASPGVRGVSRSMSLPRSNFGPARTRAHPQVSSIAPACRQAAYRRRRANAPEDTPAQRQGARGRKLNPSPPQDGATSDRQPGAK